MGKSLVETSNPNGARWWMIILRMILCVFCTVVSDNCELLAFCLDLLQNSVFSLSQAALCSVWFVFFSKSTHSQKQKHSSSGTCSFVDKLNNVWPSKTIKPTYPANSARREKKVIWQGILITCNVWDIYYDHRDIDKKKKQFCKDNRWMKVMRKCCLHFHLFSSSTISVYYST